jgi:hypothetical protein
MEQPLIIGSRTLLPIPAVMKLVPYSRDYIARLAREGKIAAAQVQRQWYIDTDSLINFYDNAQLEIRARNEYIRELRRVELESAVETADKNAAFEKSFTIAPYRSGLTTVYVLTVGCLVGLFVWHGATTFGPLMQQSQVATVSEAITTPVAEVWMEYGTVIDTTEPLTIDNGILLLPQSTSSEVNVEGLFSDPVLVTAFSTTSGEVEITAASGTSITIPYVRIPDTATVVPSRAQAP